MSGIEKKLVVRAVCAALALAGGIAHAQEAAETSLDVTIRLLPENAVGPEAITRRIELPPAPPTPPRSERAEEAPPQAAPAEREEGPRQAPPSERAEDAPRQTAPAERADRPPPAAESSSLRGQGAAGEARERGRQVGQETAEQTRENRENAGRQDTRGPPEDRGRPEDPGRPDDAGPPREPPGRP